ncbi:ArsA-related P-loop ATPase [Jatrophihabitans sp.]|uniref:ArsA-related P-loop ATPase n=1 Tax=Jatrophihabitans sp. TaxID=1932789 RepID=UPI002F2552C8
MATDERTPRLHIVTGKGGTGKTTVAGALALALAGQAKRVLLVEVEGRQGLAQLFDTPPLPYAETRLAAAGGGEVAGLAVDAEAAMLEYLEMFYSIKRAGSILRKMGAIDFVTTIAPGLRDVLLTGKVKEAVTRTDRTGRPSFDAVVLDAPPTGRITQFLQITHEVAGLAKVGPIHRQSQGVIELLHSDLTRVHIVTLLEEMPVQETLDAAAELSAAGYRLGRLLVNRARPALVSAGRPDPAALAKGLAAAGLDPALAPGLADEVSAYGQRQDVQARAAADLEEAGVPITRLPELPPPLDLGSLFELADALDVRAWSA